MTNDDIRAALFSLQDTKYRDFQAKLLPTLAAEKIIGVRTPALRKLAKEIAQREDCAGFLRALPHPYFDENQLHAFIISAQKDFDRAIAETKRFLPFINNWATCDQLSPKVFKKNRPSLLSELQPWLKSAHPYTARFAIGMLMQHFLGDDFKSEYAELVAGVRSEEYYVNMMVAWYFATALAKNYDAALPFITEQRLSKWTHNKAIQKAVESYRISDDKKEFLRGFKI